MLRIADKKFTSVLYDNLFESSSYDCTINKVLKGTVTNRHHYSKDESQEWFGFDSQAIAEEKIKFGWAEGVERIQELAIKEINPVSLKRKRVRQSQGDELDIHAVNRGDFGRAWTKTKRMNVNGVKNKNITLFCNLTSSWHLTADMLFYRGASILKITEALTEVGYNVSIYGFSVVDKAGDDKKNNFTFAQLVEIKSLDNPLDLNNLASVIASPAYKRLYLHGGVVDECEIRGIVSRDGLGGTCFGDFEIIQAITSLGCFSDTYFIQPYQIFDQKQAEEWIDSVMEQIEGQ